MALAPRDRNVAVGLALLSAFLWATYYPFVLWLAPKTPPSAVIVYPFLLGGIAYAAYTAYRGHGRAFARLWAQPASYLRTSLLLGMQFSVLGATYLVGPVDASLLSLIGDVVLTPILVALLYAVHRPHIGTPSFAAGILLSLVGGGLTIVGGTTLGAVHGAGWLVVPVVPLTVAVYFLLCAKENERTVPEAVVGQTMLAAGVIGLVVAGLVPGGYSGLRVVDPVALGLLAATGVTSFFIAPLLYFVSIRVAGIVIPPMLMTGIPVFTLALSATVLMLGLPLVAVLGIPIAVVGALLTLRGESVATVSGENLSVG